MVPSPCVVFVNRIMPPNSSKIYIISGSLCRRIIIPAVSSIGAVSDLGDNFFTDRTISIAAASISSRVVSFPVERRMVPNIKLWESNWIFL
jgi:hypothetical protein